MKKNENKAVESQIVFSVSSHLQRNGKVLEKTLPVNFTTNITTWLHFEMGPN